MICLALNIYVTKQFFTFQTVQVSSLCQSVTTLSQPVCTGQQEICSISANHFTIVIACRWTKTALTGSFWSPSYPKTYKDKAWCEWYINVPWNYIISITFLDFRLEMIDMCVTANCDCDYVEVQENYSNGTSAIVGKYCMGVAYPHGVIKTRSNNVTVTFRSDYTVGSVGFKARYDAIQVTGRDCGSGS